MGACFPLGHGDIWAQAAAEDHVCVHSPMAARVCVAVCGSYYCRKPKEPCLLKSNGCAEWAPPFAGPARDGPASQGKTGPTLERAPPLTMGMGELAPVARTLKSCLCPSPEGRGPRGTDWPDQLPPRSTSRAWDWPTPTSTPSMTCVSA